MRDAFSIVLDNNTLMSLNDCLMRWENREEGGVHNRHTTTENSPPYRRVESSRAKPKCQRMIPKLIFLCECGEMLGQGCRSGSAGTALF